MGSQMIQCSVVVPTAKSTPVTANAFRIVPDTGSDYFLDFMLYSPASQRASVVARVRVHEDCLAGIRDRLSHDLDDLGDLRVSFVAPGSSAVN